MEQRSEAGSDDVGTGVTEGFTADDLLRLGRLIGAVPVPAHLMEEVLAQVRAHRAAMDRVDEALINRERWFDEPPVRAQLDGVEAQ
jgi:hypothetical protein